MYDQFMKVYEIFKEKGLEDPLLDTLKLFDIASIGELRKTNLSSLEEKGVDLHQVADKRKEGVPLEYIIGYSPFMGLQLHCTPDALIPREETELLTRTAIGYIKSMQKDKKDLTLIEIGTGAGNIAVSIAYYTKNTSIIATDISNEAIEAAKKNIDMYDFDDRISLVCGDVFEPLKDKNLEGSVDMVVCNPPYIPTKSLTNLAPEIIDHEPEVALNAGPYGIDIFNKLIKEAVIFLRDQGVLIFEIGVGQEKLVNMLFKKNKGYDNIQHIDDGENVRVISALKSSSASTGSR